MDIAHLHFGHITGRVPNIEKCHKALSEIELHAGVPEDVRGQFNVARNMALYQYFMYALAPEVQMKTFSVIELALRRRLEPANRSGLASLSKKPWSWDCSKMRGFGIWTHRIPAMGSQDVCQRYCLSFGMLWRMARLT